MVLWEHQESRCPSPARDALRWAGRAARLVGTRTRHRQVGPGGAVWPQTSDWLVPIPEYRGEQLRCLAFGQPRPGRNAQLAQQCRLFLGGGLLAPERRRLHQTCHPEVARVVFRQPLGIGQRQRVAQPHGLRVAAHLHHLPGVRPIGSQPQRPMLRPQRQDPGPLSGLYPA